MVAIISATASASVTFVPRRYSWQTIKVDARPVFQRGHRPLKFVLVIITFILDSMLFEYFHLLIFYRKLLLKLAVASLFLILFNFCQRLPLTPSLASCSYNHLGIWLLRSDEFKKLTLINFLVCIQINSSDACQLVHFSCLNAQRIEEPRQILLVNKTHANVINLFEGNLLIIAFLGL